MTTLQEHQFEILPSAEAFDGVVFGIGADISVAAEGFDPGEAEWLTQDTPNMRRGVNSFGRDVRGAMTWTWESHINREEREDALESLDIFSGAWSPETLALLPGELTAVRYLLGGRHRRVFGRPRRFAAPPTNQILNGFIPVTHDFACVDSYTYDDVASSAQILYSTASSGGGFTLPAVMPISTQPSNGYAVGQLTVTGTARAYPVVRFNGPWTNPSLDTGDWRLIWKGTIPVNDWVEIDCRPWRNTVLTKAGGSAVEGLDRRVWLEDCWFAPNSQPQLSLGGSAASGDASAVVTWRNTWTSV